MLTKEKVMTTQEVADRFYTLAQQGKLDQIHDELYGNDVRSIEPEHAGWEDVQGIDKVKEKTRKFDDSVETMHNYNTSKPQVGGDFFSCVMSIDATYKGKGRMKVDEICVYQVKDGKIMLEQFFF